jgi:perosamine synthetase
MPHVSSDTDPPEFKMIPVAEPSITELEVELVAEAVRSTWVGSHGPFITQAEQHLASATGGSHALVTSNGTVALHLVLAALGAGPGDEVIVPSLTYVATANAVAYTGATPVFADVDPESWTLDPVSVASAITERTKGIIPVHLYGHPADMDAIIALAEEHGIWVVEDAAEALFATYKGRPVGACATAGIFSFFGNKILTSGEGGAVVTNDEALAEHMRRLRNQGMDPARRYFFPEIGFNYRMTNVAAAILCAQFRRADELVNRRARVYGWYNDRLVAAQGIGFQPKMPWATIAPWLYSVLILEEAGRRREDVTEFLTTRGVDTRPFFYPLHQLPPYRDAPRTGLEVTERLARQGMNLPTAASMSEADVDRVTSALREALA